VLGWNAIKQERCPVVLEQRLSTVFWASFELPRLLFILVTERKSMDSDKMADEKLEHRKGSMVEEGFGDVDDSVVKKVLWKMDVRYVMIIYREGGGGVNAYRILPVLALLFLCSFIDRTNVGNAKILGLEDDLNINDHQYAVGLCVFYATYIARCVRM
jgi:hypothetical protein